MDPESYVDNDELEPGENVLRGRFTLVLRLTGLGLELGFEGPGRSRSRSSSWFSSPTGESATVAGRGGLISAAEADGSGSISSSVSINSPVLTKKLIMSNVVCR